VQSDPAGTSDFSCCSKNESALGKAVKCAGLGWLVLIRRGNADDGLWVLFNWVLISL